MRTDFYARKVADTIAGTLAYYDREQVCRYANHAFVDWFGLPASGIIDKISIKELLGTVYEMNLPFLEKAYEGIVQEFERDFVTPSGEHRQSLATYIPDVEDGEVRGIIVQVVDVTQLKNIERELKLAKEKAEALATHDFLTGLPNRVLLKDRIETAVCFARREKSRIAVCMMDMDGFKSVNDTYGHPTGDAVLKEIAARFTASMRDYDSIARFGGDEFVILLTGIVDRVQVAEVLDRLLRAAKSPIQVNDTVIHPTFSIGIALYPEDGKATEELLHNADWALYSSKKRGKNSYSFFAESPDRPLPEASPLQGATPTVEQPGSKLTLDFDEQCP